MRPVPHRASLSSRRALHDALEPLRQPLEGRGGAERLGRARVRPEAAANPGARTRPSSCCGRRPSAAATAGARRGRASAFGRLPALNARKRPSPKSSGAPRPRRSALRSRCRGKDLVGHRASAYPLASTLIAASSGRAVMPRSPRCRTRVGRSGRSVSGKSTPHCGTRSYRVVSSYLRKRFLESVASTERALLNRILRNSGR
jgi:hypothetical protein